MSANCLVIVESPNKVKTIQKYLDAISPDTYKVMASFGHICDLPKNELGFDTKTFEPKYEIYKEKQDLVNNLKRAARSHTHVLMATDDDREGEAIALHLARELKIHNPDRITFGSITKEALGVALKNARKIDQKKVDSQETRRILDRIIGWLVSSVARLYVVPDSSMGRVQTAVLCLLVHLERRIREFSSINHYGVDVSFINTETDPNIPWTATWDASKWMEPDQEYWLDRASAETVKGIKSFKVTSVTEGVSESAPPAPLITSTLQRAAQKVLKISPTQTMKLAQRLYESGAITYMRTDNPNFSPEAFVALRKYAHDNELPVVDKQRTFKSKAGAQEAHEAIRPTSFALKKVGEGEIQDLYNLIWMRAVACQLKSATFETKEVLLEQSVEVVINGVLQTKTAHFKARGRKQTYDGWQQLTKADFSELEEEEKEVLPNNFIPKALAEGDVISVSDCQLREKKTAPPTRLTSSSLIGKLESVGIGRPSTFASIIETLEARNYIRYEKDRIFVTDRGFKIIDTMEDKFKFIDVGYTAEMEEALDQITSGKPWFPILNGFWNEINTEVKSFVAYIHTTLPQHKCVDCQSLVIKKTFGTNAAWVCTSCNARYAENGSNKPGAKQISMLTNFACLECSRKLQYRKGEYQGVEYETFSCSGSSDNENKCFARYEPLKGTNPVEPDFEKYKEMTKYKCKICDRKLLHFVANKGVAGKERPFWKCTGNVKDNPVCTAFYDDMNGQPDYAAFELNHKYKCVECQGFISRVKKKDGDQYFWVCRNIPKNRKTPCGVFYDDVDTQPDYDKYARDHEHKCPNCNSFISLRKGPTGDMWRCARKNAECGWSFGSDPLEPNIEAAKQRYKHKCPNCKIGYLDKGESARGAYWRCVSGACKTFLPDIDGVPDLEGNEPQKKKGKK